MKKILGARAGPRWTGSATLSMTHQKTRLRIFIHNKSQIKNGTNPGMDLPIFWKFCSVRKNLPQTTAEFKENIPILILNKMLFLKFRF